MKPKQAWDIYVGRTSPEQFMNGALDMSVADAVHDYVNDLPNLQPEFFDCLTIAEKKKQAIAIEKMLIAHINETL